MNEYGIGCTDAGLFDTTPGEDLSAYEGCGVYFDGTAWQAASLTSQSVTQLLGSDEAIAVIVQGAETTEKLELAYVTQRGYIEAKAGTGGVTAGDYIVTEYAASGTDRGRFVTADALHANQWVWGKALSTVAEDGLFILDMGAAFQSAGQWTRTPTDLTGANKTLTADEICSGVLNRDCSGAGKTDTLPTATLLLAAMQARGYGAGEQMRVSVTNVSDAAEALTIATGSGITLVTAGADQVISRYETAELIFSIITVSPVAIGCLSLKA
jgi:hypothetical protein